MKNREIKFRIIFQNKINGYERLGKEGWQWMSLQLNPDKGERWTAGVYPQNSRYIRKQFIGLKDKNGKDIYHSDFIKDQWGEISEIIWNENNACFEATKTHVTEGDMKKSEVIGNIYENNNLI